MRFLTMLGDHLPIDEIRLGLIYGLTIMASLLPVGIVGSRSDISKGVWTIVWTLICLSAGGWMLGEYEDPNVQNRLFTMLLLVGLCRFGKGLNDRIKLGGSRSRQFGIAELMMLSTAAAFLLFFVKRTSLLERDAWFWIGMFVFASCFAIGFSAGFWGRLWQCLILVGMACLAAFAFAGADSHWIQPDRLPFGEAVARYGAIMFGMISPQLIYLWGNALYDGTSPNVRSPNVRNGRTLFCRSVLYTAVFSKKSHDLVASSSPRTVTRPTPSDGSVGDRDVPIDEAQPALRVFG